MFGFIALAGVHEGAKAAHTVLTITLYFLVAAAVAVGVLGLLALLGLFFLARFIRHLWRNRRHPLNAFRDTPALREAFTMPRRQPSVRRPDGRY